MRLAQARAVQCERHRVHCAAILERADLDFWDVLIAHHAAILRRENCEERLAAHPIGNRLVFRQLPIADAAIQYIVARRRESHLGFRSRGG